ncbi:MAG: hypothetical protein EPO26_10320 [Chloroflexota bacterium]|nr:MAG: hypothetical protein EPO26_10320 [Chloroflexota bacterium]
MTAPTDGTYVAVCIRQLRDEVGTLLMATLLALGLALPWLAAVALGAEGVAPLLCALAGAPAWVGLLEVAGRVARDEAASPVGVVSAARRLYGHAALLGGATAGFAWAFERTLRAAGDGEAGGVPLLALATAGLLALLAADVYAFPLLALGDLRVPEAARVGLGLAAAAPGATLGMLGAGALALVALTWLGPGTLLATLPALAVLTANNTLLQLGRLDGRRRANPN